MKTGNRLFLPKLVFIGPAVIAITLLMLVPILAGLGISFTDYNISRPNAPVKPIGLANYAAVLKDSYFHSTILWTMEFALVTVAVTVIAGLFFAWLLNTDGVRKISPLFRTLFITPTMIAPVVAASMWYVLYAPIYGVLNALLALFHVGPVNWFGDAFSAKACLVLVEMWLTTPFCILTLFAAIQGVPAELYEAARIEGAGAWAEFSRITIPMIGNTLSLVISIRMMDSLRAFDLVYNLTKGGPDIATETMGTYIYRTGFRYFEISKSSAAAFLLFFIVAAVTLLNLFITRKEKEV
ncbi:MAG: sugar ABC transporter permease [Treponema sp.]|nr:sugar ABC transporter permease [Treponema sp.]